MPAAVQFETASDIDELEQIVGQTNVRVNGRTGFGWALPPHIERAAAAREAKRAPPKVTSMAAPENRTPTVHTFPATEITSYGEVIVGIKGRLAELGVRYEDFDTHCQFPDGLTGKCLGPSMVKRFGVEKLFDCIRGLGLRLKLEEDPDQTTKMKTRIAENYNPRQANQARTNNRNHTRPSEELIECVLKYLANNTHGGLTRLNRAAKQARINWSRQAALRSLRDDQGRFEDRYQNGARALPPPEQRDEEATQGKRRGSKYG